MTEHGLHISDDTSHPSPDRYYNTRNWVGRQRDRAGKLSHGCIAWMLGLPLPIVILAFLWRGCD